MALERTTLSPIELRLLAIVEASPLQTGRKLASEYERLVGEEMPFGTIYTTFRRMRKEGLLEIKNGKTNDARNKAYEITTNGKKSLESSRQFYEALSEFIL